MIEINPLALKLFHRWDFKTYNLDIKFGVRSVDNNTGVKVDEVELKRVETNDGEETGFIATEPNHTCENF